MNNTPKVLQPDIPDRTLPSHANELGSMERDAVSCFEIIRCNDQEPTQTVIPPLQPPQSPPSHKYTNPRKSSALRRRLERNRINQTTMTVVPDPVLNKKSAPMVNSIYIASPIVQASELAVPQLTKKDFSIIIGDPDHCNNEDKIDDSDFLPFFTALVNFFDSRKFRRSESLDQLLLFFAVNGTLHDCPSHFKIRALTQKGYASFYRLSSLIDHLYDTVEIEYPIRYYLLPFARRTRKLLGDFTIITGYWARMMVNNERHPSHYAWIAFDFADGLFDLDVQQYEFISHLKTLRLRAREFRHFLEF
jgi:hypothetical protein